MMALAVSAATPVIILAGGAMDELGSGVTSLDCGVYPLAFGGM